MITQLAYAKLNLNLHVLPKLLPNNYHQIKSINCEVDLSDKVTLKENLGGIKLICSNPNLVDDESNLAYKAADLIMQKFHPRCGTKITLDKQIPVTGGLGGGSTDGAAVINSLNQLWNLKLTDQEKIDLAKKLGMDVCYSVIGGICMVTGAGEIVEPLNISFPNINIIIVSPKSQKSSTAWAYKLLNQDKVGKNLEKINKILKALKEKDIFNMADNLHNDFEEPLICEFPEIAKIKVKMMKNKALNTLLAGSGLSVFGIWENQKTVNIAFNKLKKIYSQTYLCQTI